MRQRKGKKLKWRLKQRKHEHACTCGRYDHPHRFGGGKCKLYKFVEDYWNKYFGHSRTCQSCNCLVDGTCDVVEGKEAAIEGECLQDFVQRNEIKIYVKR